MVDLSEFYKRLYAKYTLGFNSNERLVSDEIMMLNLIKEMAETLQETKEEIDADNCQFNSRKQIEKVLNKYFSLR